MPACLEAQAAEQHPEYLKLADAYLDHVVAGRYYDALVSYDTLFNRVGSTRYEGVEQVIPHDQQQAAQLCLSWAMMLRQ